jgi:hypothetical protein
MFGQNPRIFGIDAEPFFESGLGVRPDCVDRAFWLADTAIDAFIRVDDEHVLALIEAVDGTYLHAVHVLTFDTALIDDVGHHLLRIVGTPAGRRFAIPMFENQFPSCVIAIDHSA